MSTRLILVGAALLGAVGAAHASLLANAAEIDAGALGIDFEAPAVVVAPRQAQIGGALGVSVGVRALDGELAFGAPASGWSLGSNGQWTDARGFVGVKGGADPDAGLYAALVFDFGTLAVRQVGATLNFDPGTTYGAGLPLLLYLAAYDAVGELLESHEVAVSTPGATNQGAFYGISMATPLIARFEVSGPWAVVDDLRFTTPVPEARALALALVGIGVLVLARVNRRG